MAWKRLTPQRIAERLAEMTALPVEHVKAVLQAQAELAYAEVNNGFSIPGIGTLIKRETAERQGRIPSGPQAGQIVTIRAKQVTKFRVSRLAKEMVLNPSPPTPDIFKPPDIPEFTFSTDMSEIDEHAPFLANLGAPFTSATNVEPMPMRYYRLPDLHLPTGRICAADPMLLPGTRPFTKSVPPGHYPLVLAAAQMDTYARIALAILRFSEKPIARWEIASTNREAPASPPARREGYGVDSATGCFCDESIVQLLGAADDLDGEFFERLAAEMSESHKSQRDWVSAESPSGSLAAFSSGAGDGFYTSYFGLDEAGHPVALVTDFALVTFPPAA